MKTEHSQAFLKKRKFFVMLPLIVIPFMVVLFWLLGGGTGEKSQLVANKGLNTQLPEAKIDNKSVLDKMSFYAQADQDSINRLQQMRMDPNYASVPEKEPETVLDKKVARLQQEVDHEDTYERSAKKSNSEIDRLQNMVQTIQEHKPDPDIEALNGTLDKLLEMQNPSRSKNSGVIEKGVVYQVMASGVNNDISFFGKSKAGTKSFLSDESEEKDSLKGGTIMAVVHNEQTVQDGSIVKLRLLQDVFVKGQTIHVGSFVYGSVSLDGERLQIKITSIQYTQHLYPVELKVFDMDGLEGIHIPGSSGRTSIKQSAEQGIQSSSVLSFDPSFKAQAAAVGVNAAKSLLSKKVKLERVTVKAGYKVMLKDESFKESDKGYAW